MLERGIALGIVHRRAQDETLGAIFGREMDLTKKPPEGGSQLTPGSIRRSGRNAYSYGGRP